MTLVGCLCDLLLSSIGRAEIEIFFELGPIRDRGKFLPVL